MENSKVELLPVGLRNFYVSPFYATISFVMSVCPHGTTRIPLDGF
jgi:hypothetical protein